MKYDKALFKKSIYFTKKKKYLTSNKKILILT